MLPLLLALSLAAPLQAATLYAKTCASGCNWSAAATWSTTGSAGIDSSGPPTSADTVILEAGSGNVVLDAVGQAALTVSMTAGTGNYAGTFSCSGAYTLALGLKATGTIWAASSAATISQTGCVISMGLANNATTITFAGAGKTYGDLTIAENAATTVRITGSNTFGTVAVALLLTAGDTSVVLDVGSTTTVGDLQTAGASLFFINLSSATGGMAATITKPNGTVNVDLLKVTDMTATGGATWCAYSASANGGGNTGWSFTACPLVPRQLVLGVQ